MKGGVGRAGLTNTNIKNISCLHLNLFFYRGVVLVLRIVRKISERKVLPSNTCFLLAATSDCKTARLLCRCLKCDLDSKVYLEDTVHIFKESIGCCLECHPGRDQIRDKSVEM
jgi:hypothetical protein